MNNKYYRLLNFRGYLVKAGLLLLGAGLFIGCPEPVEDPDPPARPLLVTKSLPEAWEEAGIDADNTGTNRIVLMWHPNQEEDLSGYEIYRADTLRTNKFRRIAAIDIFHILGADTIYHDDSISTHLNYYYYVRARDNAGNRSHPSDTVTYRLLLPPQALAPSDTVVHGPFTFIWFDRVGQYDYTTEYTLRLDNLDLNRSVWVCRFMNAWYDYANSYPIPLDYFPCSQGASAEAEVIACNEISSQLPAGVYRWKVKAISEVDNHTGLDEASAESEWAFFTIE
ncbi:MAG: hypothetical protein ABIA75_08605 [Candidatus Neomarinimicrobiota bacterium]